MKYKNIIVSKNNKIATISLNRLEVLNALSEELMSDLSDSLIKIDLDDSISVVILRGNNKVFAAGADIKGMLDKNYIDLVKKDIFKNWETVSNFRKPIIASVAGYALGGGCELAMMCDFIIAADNAKFSLPEINLGTFPAAGGTQRLPRFIGKSKAMEMILTGKMINSKEAENSGLVSEVVDLNKLDKRVEVIANTIAKKSLPILLLAKEAVNRSYETSLHEGLLFERRAFQSSFALEDRKEGMRAFLTKRQPSFKNK